jgi:hypothetical protein
MAECAKGGFAGGGTRRSLNACTSASTWAGRRMGWLNQFDAATLGVEAAGSNVYTQKKQPPRKSVRNEDVIMAIKPPRLKHSAASRDSVFYRWRLTAKVAGRTCPPAVLAGTSVAPPKKQETGVV